MFCHSLQVSQRFRIRWLFCPCAFVQLALRKHCCQRLRQAGNLLVQARFNLQTPPAAAS